MQMCKWKEGGSEPRKEEVLSEQETIGVSRMTERARILQGTAGGEAS